MDKIAELFTKNIKTKLKKHLVKFYLYGSRARGDYKSSSDYDFLIVVDNKNKAIEELIMDETLLILNEFNELISTIIYEAKEWEFKKYIPLGKNVLKEGITL